jgi:PAS domain S-box-containing protein
MATELPVASEANADFRLIFESAPDAIVVVGGDARITLVNQQAEKMFGYARAELVGQPLTILIPERFRAAHKGHEARFFSSPVARPMGSRLELFGRTKDGREIPIEVSLSPLGEGTSRSVSAAIRDISERKRLEASARVTGERLSSAVESIQDAFALFDDNDHLVLCNSVYRRLVGDSLSGPLIGRSYREILRAWLPSLAFSDDEKRDRFLHERLAARHAASTAAFDVHMQDGRRLRIMDRRTPEGGLVKTIWDLTDEQRRAEELQEARQLAEAGSAAKSEFVSSMSHELRTPLNAILGFAQLLKRDRLEPLSERHKERVAQILTGGQHLLRLIDDILDLSRIEAKGVSISIEPVSVPEVLAEAAAALEPLATRAGVSLALEPVPPAVPLVSVDRTRFAQVVMNFGSNAIKYNRTGGRVTLHVSTPSPDRVRVLVKDDGMGIPLDKQDKLFQPFQRAGQETGPIEGTGIGLVITKRLAELMGGAVGFHSVPGEGSEFWVDVPVHAASAPTAPSAQGSDPTTRLAPAGQRLILYVEDNPANVRFLKDLVSTFENVELVSMPTAELGLEHARARRPDIVIMDINLPGMSGIEALQALRAAPETKDIPVIALTAAATDRDRQRGLEAGFYRYLTKPVDVDELVAALESVLVVKT